MDELLEKKSRRIAGVEAITVAACSGAQMEATKQDIAKIDSRFQNMKPLEISKNEAATKKSKNEKLVEEFSKLIAETSVKWQQPERNSER